jgi:hypothetical protein
VVKSFGSLVYVHILCGYSSCKDAAMDWIIHLDTDELLYPGGGAEYSVRHLLADVPGDVDMVIFPNYVSNFKSNQV